MTTKDITEAILYINKDTYKAFRAAHILNDFDRNWKPKEHIEYPWLKAFYEPKFLIIVEQQIHVYIIGDIFKGKSYNVINIEGYQADHMCLNKSQITEQIRNNVKEQLYLPESLNERIIFIDDRKIYVFNRKTYKGNMFSKSKWSLGTDIYSVSVQTYDTNANEILKNIYDEF